MIITPTADVVDLITVKLPPDKSLTHRALLFAAMADGESVIDCPSVAHDCMSTRAAVEAFGVHIDQGKLNGSAVYRLRSPGLSRWRIPEHVIDAGNSGTTARLLIGLGSAVGHLSFEIKGDDSLMRRPMGRVVEPLMAAGADIKGPEDGTYLPIRVQGRKLQGFRTGSPIVSAQVKSALLLAASLAQGESEIRVPAGTRDHTERMMKAMGANVRSEVTEGVETFRVVGPWNVGPFRAIIPRDPSAMAFFAVLAFVKPGLRVRCEGVLGNEGRLTFLKILERAGLTVTQSPSKGSGCPGESLADFEFFRDKEPRPIFVKSHEVASMIDEIPALAVAACVSSEESLLEGLGELKVKESNRLEEIATLLTRAGLTADIVDEDLRIRNSARVKSFNYNSIDHRMIMAAAVLATIAAGPCTIGPIDAARVSFPLFFERLRQIYGE